MDQLKSKIRDIADFPIKGIIFKDITPLVQDPISLRLAVSGLVAPFKNTQITAVAGIEARGFIFGSLVAWQLNVGFIPLRKPGRLPFDLESVDYNLEYGSASLEVHTDAINPGDRILVIDDFVSNRWHGKSQLPIS